MKVLLISLALILANSCKSTSEKEAEQQGNTTETSMNMKEMCPEGGECTVEVRENATLTVADDEATGGLYSVIEAGNKTVVTYTYAKKGPAGTADGNYSETIQFELPEVTNTMSLSDSNLQDVQLLFGKQCYCKGEAGHYRVTNGSLKLEKTNKGIMMHLDFKVPEVTEQRVTSISRMISM
ncbi:hypothetical protein [Cochleicola gelatinilyticus]|uniref:Uncharacterized protein n=1 Tax=Cochleicola gelatinilyticus TaxID=1763537 RepID=A0A167II19_9FLAO|nr:hypothetical protein [Cochleicola gelatinilyticus]OAB79674.1 hypothetical protein ULVI_02690 [Cochleicola gelatinilyticus]